MSRYIQSSESEQYLCSLREAVTRSPQQTPPAEGTVTDQGVRNVSSNGRILLNAIKIIAAVAIIIIGLVLLGSSIELPKLP